MPPPPDPTKLDTVDRLARLDFVLIQHLRETCRAEFSAAGLPRLFQGAGPLLIYLHRHGASQLGAIAEGTGQSPAAMTRSAKEFVARGLATRRTDAKDARACWLELTELGEKYAVIAEKGRAEAVGMLLSGMNKAQAARFDECLDLALNALKKAR